MSIQAIELRQMDEAATELQTKRLRISPGRRRTHRREQRVEPLRARRSWQPRGRPSFHKKTGVARYNGSEQAEVQLPCNLLPRGIVTSGV